MKRIKIENLAGKSIDELIQENNALVKYLDGCVAIGEDGREYLDSDCDLDKLQKSNARYKQLQEIIAFNTSQQKIIREQELRAEIAKNREIILQANDGCCYVCGFDLVDVLVIHHISPVSEGGTNSLDNLAVLCPTCHAIVHKAMSNSKADYRFVQQIEDYYVKWQIERVHNLAFTKSKSPELI